MDTITNKWWFGGKLLIVLFTLNASMAFDMTINGSLLSCDEKSDGHLFSPYHAIGDCHRKIRLTIDIFNTKKTPEGFEFIYLTKVLDPGTGISLRLMNPLVIRLRQMQVILAYPFKYLSAVNGKATEVVVTYENRKNYTGCDDISSIHPTCGIKHEKGRAVPYSEGFCCFCPEAAAKEKQIRGGQDCSLEVDPADFERQRYKASAHCLQFNPVWYTVSALQDPIVIHNIYLEVYNQRFLANGSEIWVSLTGGEEFELGNKNPSRFDERKTIVASYHTANPKNGTLLISPEVDRLLIPQPMPGVEHSKLPDPVKNGALDYLLIPKSVIDPTGKECDTAGVSYEAFSRQPDRCNVVKNTCLKNQPLDLWLTADEKRRGGKTGKYLLQNYGTPYKDPIFIDKETKEHWLALEYYEKQHTVVTVEFNADNIVPLTPGKYAQISKVISASSQGMIQLFVIVANKDLVLSTFYVKAIDCQYGVPDSNNQSKPVPPQVEEEFVLSTKPGDLELSEIFTCSVEVSNTLYGVVATREVLMKPLQRCICNMHCKCVCLGGSLKCEPMEMKDYHAAGFRGSLPVLTAKPPHKTWIIAHPFLAIFALLLILLLIGFAKAIIGFKGYKRVGHFGLKSLIFRRKKLKQYFEPELKKYDVCYDSEGYPVIPNTDRRTMVLSEELIFAFNTLFCCMWPCLKLVNLVFKRKEDPDPSSAVSVSDSMEDENESYNGQNRRKETEKSLPDPILQRNLTTSSEDQRSMQESLETNKKWSAEPINDTTDYLDEGVDLRVSTSNEEETEKSLLDLTLQRKLTTSNEDQRPMQEPPGTNKTGSAETINDTKHSNLGRGVDPSVSTSNEGRPKRIRSDSILLPPPIGHHGIALEEKNRLRDDVTKFMAFHKKKDKK